MGWEGGSYQARFDELAAEGHDVHGEARFILDLAPTSVLDAGCGTGRVAIELSRHGVEAVGVDVDPSMLSTARRRAPEVAWLEVDMASPNLDLGRTFDVVAMAGNVPLFTQPGANPSLVAACARHVGATGSLVAGFQLGRGYELAEYDGDCAAAGLVLAERWATWDRQPFAKAGEYAVSVHRRIRHDTELHDRDSAIDDRLMP